MEGLFVHARKHEIETKIAEIEEKLFHLKSALQTGKYLNFENCKHCGGSGWVHINAFTTGIRNCSCEYGNKRIPNTPSIHL